MLHFLGHWSNQYSKGVSFLGPTIWDVLPDDCKDLDDLNTFKNKVKACVRYFLSNFNFSPNDSPSKTMTNAFYFI